MNRYEQAVSGLRIRRGVLAEEPALGVVAVNDGDSRWLVDSRAWGAAEEKLEAQPAIGGDEGGAEAYTALCTETRAAAKRMGLAMVSDYDCVGDAAAQVALVRAALDAGLPMTRHQESMAVEPGRKS